MAANGRNGLKSPLQPAAYPQRYALNERVFSRANPADFAELRQTYGVRWLFADMSNGASEALDRVADLRHRDGEFAVYEVRDR